MTAQRLVVDLAEAGAVARDRIGAKAAVLGELAAAGLPVPAGFVVTAAALDDPDRLDPLLAEALGRVGARFAVRSSGVAEDLPDASYAGLYETYLNVEPDRLTEAVRRCFAAAVSHRVSAYDERRAVGGSDGARMAVLVQAMVDAEVAGVAFTAHPVTGDRDQIVITAVPGLADPLVSGETVGEEWTVTAGPPAGAAHGLPARTRRMPDVDAVMTADQARQVADLARRIADRYGRPQDVEWAIDADGRLWLLQARPMTALPEPVSWTPPGPGLWMRNFRLGEWLPEAVTPLFATWLLPLMEDGYLDGMHATIGVRVPFRYALVNGWYYNATPIPSPRLLVGVLREGRGRAVKALYNALIQVSRDPAAADRAVLADLYRRWRERQLPRYRQLVTSAQAEAQAAAPARLAELVDQIGREAGAYLWFLAIVGGSAWKMEARLTRWCRRHLDTPLQQHGGSAQVLLRGLPGTQPTSAAHAVQSVDWYHPVAAELGTPGGGLVTPGGGGLAASGGELVKSGGGELVTSGAAGHTGGRERHRELGERRTAAERACRAALSGTPRLRARFEALLEVAQRYAVIREEQARDLTLGWPVLRMCAYRLGERLVADGIITQVDEVFFCTRAEVEARIGAGVRVSLADVARKRREVWERQRRLAAPLTLGRPPRLVGDVIERAVRAARGSQDHGEEVIVGHPASAGRVTGRARVVLGPQDFAAFAEGEVLVAKATAPAWTPLFARAAAVVTDGGTLAAHASLIAREYGIPAVVGTGDATHRLHTGQMVAVDGTAGTVTAIDATG